MLSPIQLEWRPVSAGNMIVHSAVCLTTYPRSGPHRRRAACPSSPPGRKRFAPNDPHPPG